MRISIKMELKRHWLSNLLTSICLLAVLFLTVYSALFAKTHFDSKGKDKNDFYRLTWSILETKENISISQTNSILNECENLVDTYSCRIYLEDLAGNKVYDFKEKTSQRIDSEQCASISNQLNDGQIRFIIEGKKKNSDIYVKLFDTCEKAGVVIGITEDQENEQKRAGALEQSLYKLICGGCCFFSLLILCFCVFLWFIQRRHEWFIRHIFGVPVEKLTAESFTIFISILIFDYLLVAIVLGMYQPSYIITILLYGIIGVIVSIIVVGVCNIKFSNIKRVSRFR